MSRYRAIIAETATGIVRRADAPNECYLEGEGGQSYCTFDSEQDALNFKDDVLSRFSDVEVWVRPEDAKVGGTRFYISEGKQVAGLS